jgi:Flp pilus assembly protein protease CpaA
VLSTRIASVAGGAMAVVAFGLAWMAGVAAGSQARIFTVSPFFAGTSPPLLWLVWCAAWTAAVLAVGILLLRRREL